MASCVFASWLVLALAIEQERTKQILIGVTNQEAKTQEAIGRMQEVKARLALSQQKAGRISCSRSIAEDMMQFPALAAIDLALERVDSQLVQTVFEQCAPYRELANRAVCEDIRLSDPDRVRWETEHKVWMDSRAVAEEGSSHPSSKLSHSQASTSPPGPLPPDVQTAATMTQRTILQHLGERSSLVLRDTSCSEGASDGKMFDACFTTRDVPVSSPLTSATIVTGGEYKLELNFDVGRDEFRKALVQLSDRVHYIMMRRASRDRVITYLLDKRQIAFFMYDASIWYTTGPLPLWDDIDGHFPDGFSLLVRFLATSPDNHGYQPLELPSLEKFRTGFRLMHGCTSGQVSPPSVIVESSAESRRATLFQFSVTNANGTVAMFVGKRFATPWAYILESSLHSKLAGLPDPSCFLPVRYFMKDASVLVFDGVATALSDVAYSDELLCSVGLRIAKALHQIHAAGLVHCDLSFGNILILREGVYLSDFGAVRKPGVISGPIGTPRFSSIRMGYHFRARRFLSSEKWSVFTYSAYDDWLALILVLVAFSCSPAAFTDVSHTLPWDPDDAVGAHTLLMAFARAESLSVPFLDQRMLGQSADRLRPLVRAVLEMHPLNASSVEIDNEQLLNLFQAAFCAH